MPSKLSVGVVFITHRAVQHLHRCLPPFLAANCRPRVLVVNSSSNDGTIELAHAMGAETLLIPRHQFNHGTTRELARKHLGTDIVIMVTPDAYACDDTVVDKLIQPLQQRTASVSYARQIPHVGADFFEAFSRDFNYPNESHIRSLKNIAYHGVYTYFCSNTCAAYLNSALDEIGGFTHSLFGEDTIAAAKLLNKNHSIAYVAEAVVHHSHSYTLKQEFKRHFDIGLSRKMHQHLFQSNDTQRGKAYLNAMLKRLSRENPRLIPYALLQTLFKFTGYHAGRASLTCPRWFKKMLSSQDFYWI